MCEWEHFLFIVMIEAWFGYCFIWIWFGFEFYLLFSAQFTFILMCFFFFFRRNWLLNKFTHYFKNDTWSWRSCCLLAKWPNLKTFLISFDDDVLFSSSSSSFVALFRLHCKTHSHCQWEWFVENSTAYYEIDTNAAFWIVHFQWAFVLFFIYFCTFAVVQQSHAAATTRIWHENMAWRW